MRGRGLLSLAFVFAVACTAGSSGPSTTRSTPPVTTSLAPSSPPASRSGGQTPSPIPSNGFIRTYPNPFLGAGAAGSLSGLSGTVSQNAVCEFQNPPCTITPSDIPARVIAERNGAVVASARTDSSGHYVLALSPGSAILSAIPDLQGLRCPRGPVTVPAGHYLGADLICIQSS